MYFLHLTLCHLHFDFCFVDLYPVITSLNPNPSLSTWFGGRSTKSCIETQNIVTIKLEHKWKNLASTNYYNSFFNFASDAMMTKEQFILTRTEINSLRVSKAAILKLNSNEFSSIILTYQW